MSLNPSTYFINVLCDNKKQYRIHTTWSDENNFILTLIDDFKAYTSNVSNEDLRNLSKNYDCNFGAYLEEVRKSLCTKNLSNIIYKRKDNKFTISRKQGKISVKFADFIISETDFNNAVVNIIDDIDKSNKFYQNETSIIKDQMKIATEEKNKYIQKLEEFTNKKTDFEHELYTKFILVLNEKKLRIQYLQETLKKLQRGKEQLKADNEMECKINGTKREIISDSDTETSIDEPVKTIVHNVQIECNDEISKNKLNFFEDDTTLVKSLPKRTVANTNPGPSKKMMKVNEEIEYDTVVSSSKEITKNEETVAESNDNDVQHSENYNTQDLIDAF